MIIEKNILNDFDNQTLTYHKIVDCIVDQNSTNVSFVVGSWVNSDFENDKPALKTRIDVHYDQWSFEYYNSGVETVMGHPDWSGIGPEKPNLSYIWNPITLNWVAPLPIPLEDLKISKWNDIKILRSAIEFGGFSWNGNFFDSTQLSVIRITTQTQSAIISKLAGTEFNINWKLKDNTLVTLSNEDMISVSLALSNHVIDCHAKSVILKSQIDSSQSILQISQVVW